MKFKQIVLLTFVGSFSTCTPDIFKGEMEHCGRKMEAGEVEKRVDVG